MDAKKSVRQYKPASKTPARRKKKEQSSWARSLSWFRSNIKDNEDVDPKKRVEHGDNLRFVWGAVLARWGYEVAHWLMDNTFGVSSILIPILMLATSIRIMGLAKVRLHLWFLNCMIIMAWASAFAALPISFSLMP